MELSNFALFFVVFLSLNVSPIHSRTGRHHREYKRDSSQKLRIVTWNVADNGRMSDGFTPEALDKVLGLTDTKRGGENLPDIYVIGLQEQCWKCNKDNFGQILEKFEERLKPHGDYAALGMEGTRESSYCQVGCTLLRNHGTTGVVVLARRGVVVATSFDHINDGCSSSIPENDEKGVAFARLKLSNERSICVASAHLDSRKPNLRRQCLKSFFEAAEQTVDWSSCSSKFIFGDFNTRTGDKTPKSSLRGIDSIPQTTIEYLRRKDELMGSEPYGTDSGWSKNMMEYINNCQRQTYKELPLNFAPTYKMNDGSLCFGKIPCYRADRPISWTDRIIYSGAVGVAYDSINVQSSDHFPVMAEFEV